MKQSLAILVLIALVGIAGGTCVIRQRAVVVSAAVPVAVTPVAVTVPQYAASYDNTSAVIGELRGRVAALEARVAALEGRAPKSEQLANPKESVGLPALFQRSCVKCHTVGVESKGGGHVWFHDGALTMTLEQRLEAIRRINLAPDDKDVMPPKKSGMEPANDKEAAEALDVLTRRVNAAAPKSPPKK